MILILGTSPMLGPSEYYNASNFTYIDHRIIKVTNFGCYKWKIFLNDIGFWKDTLVKNSYLQFI